MAANSASTLARSASSCAGAVFAAIAALSPSASTSTTIAAATATAATTSSSKSKFSPNHRPNRAELESRLFHAHVRAHKRRLYQALGHGLPSSVAPRTSRTVGCSVPRDPSTPSTSTTLAPSSPLSMGPSSPFTNTTNTTTSPESLNTDRPRFPHRRSRVAPFRRVGLGLQLDILEEDAIVSPSHVFPATLRRTPGAPLWVKDPREGDSDTAGSSSPGSYFHLPPNLFSPAAPPAPTTITSATIGLGIFGVDFGEDGRIEENFPPDAL